MDKPVSLSMKAWIIRNMSVRIGVQENIIETVVNHQFESAYVALETCNTMEFSGFGRFLFNVPKAHKKLESLKCQLSEYYKILDDENTIENKRSVIELKVEIITKSINYLNRKLNGTEQTLRRVEKQIVSLEGIEGADTKGEGTKALNM